MTLIFIFQTKYHLTSSNADQLSWDSLYLYFKSFFWEGVTKLCCDCLAMRISFSAHLPQEYLRNEDRYAYTEMLAVP